MPKRSPTLNRAYAYFRLAAKAQRAGEWAKVTRYTKHAERLVAEARRQRESLTKLKVR